MTKGRFIISLSTSTCSFTMGRLFHIRRHVIIYEKPVNEVSCQGRNAAKTTVRDYPLARRGTLNIRMARECGSTAATSLSRACSGCEYTHSMRAGAAPSRR